MTEKRRPLDSGIVHSHFDTRPEPASRQLTAWRERVGHLIDVVPTLEQVERPFSAAIDRYEVGGIVLSDCRSDAVMMERTVARISTDHVRDFVFHVFVSGGFESVTGACPARVAGQSRASILALDMNQPVRMQRGACRALCLFVPGALVESAFPGADAIHGRVIEETTPLTRLCIEQVAAIGRELPGMRADEADQALRGAVHLLSAALAKQARLTGDARAAVRAAMFGKVRRYVRANLHNEDLSPERVLNELALSRPTIYRMFEHEGGLGAYIRNQRLREAADDLVKYPHLAIADVAYGLGFKSPSDFSRAFRRAYGMAPLDLRVQALARQHADKNGMGDAGNPHGDEGLVGAPAPR